MAIGDSITRTAEAPGRRGFAEAVDPTKSAFFWLSAFFVVYCARPEDWIPGLNLIPCAKITAILAMWGLFNSWGKTKRTLKDVPKEGRLLLLLIGLLFVSGFLSPIWRGGAVRFTIDYSKVFIAWILAYLLITSFERLRRIMFIQASCVAVICAVSIIKGHSQPRLEGVIGGIYSNPNDLAFALEPLHALLVELLTGVADAGLLREDVGLATQAALLQELLLATSHSAVLAGGRQTRFDDMWAFCSAAILRPGD